MKLDSNLRRASLLLLLSCLLLLLVSTTCQASPVPAEAGTEAKAVEPASEQKPQSEVAVVATELDYDDEEVDKSESPAAAAASALVNIFALVV